MSKNILVIGSTNMDMVVKVPYFPKPGETIMGGDFFMNQGGKGANQAVTVSRLNGNIEFICKTGNDSISSQMKDLFIAEGISEKWILKDNNKPSGVAIIMVDKNAENSIVVAPGANSNLSPKDIENSLEAIRKADYILIQLEIPIETVEYVVKIASHFRKKVILNPAPMASLSDEILKEIYLITPNRIEAETLAEMNIVDGESLIKVAKAIYNKGVENIIITLGSDGALVYNGDFKMIPAIKTDPVDTTGAGDVFNGALTVALAEGLDLFSAVKFANRASAISITRRGAILSIPYRNELTEFISTNNK